MKKNNEQEEEEEEGPNNIWRKGFGRKMTKYRVKLKENDLLSFLNPKHKK